MCGRFGVSTPENIEDRFNTMGTSLDMSPRYNVAPSQRVPAITRNSPNKAELMIWGFVPHWADPKTTKLKPINARDDSMSKPFYREALKETRCIMPFSFYYEWKRFSLDGQDQKVPYPFQVKGEPLMGFAGLYSLHHDAEGREVKTCCLITTTPNSLAKKVHNRMPVILKKEDEDLWLDPESKIEDLKELLKPYPAKEMETWRVSTYVNSPKNDAPELIAPVSDED